MLKIVILILVFSAYVTCEETRFVRQAAGAPGAPAEGHHNEIDGGQGQGSSESSAGSSGAPGSSVGNPGAPGSSAGNPGAPGSSAGNQGAPGSSAASSGTPGSSGGHPGTSAGHPGAPGASSTVSVNGSSSIIILVSIMLSMIYLF